MSQQSRNRNKGNFDTRGKQEITLLTLLANESTRESNGLLKKYGKAPAKDFQDLEVKLAELYFGESDKKLEIEKDFAEIHPHKKWMLRYVAPIPVIKEEVKVEPIIEPVKVVEIKKEPIHCDCQDCMKVRMMANMGKMSGIDGSNESDIAKRIFHTDKQTMYVTLGVVAVVAMFGLVLSKTK